MAAQPDEHGERDTLRAEFERECVERGGVDLRNTALVVLVFYSLFALLDYVLYPDLFRQFLYLRLAVAAISVCLFFACRIPFVQRHHRGFAMFMYFATGLPIIAMVHLGGGYASPYYAGINLVLLGLLFLLPMDPVRTAITGFVLYACYLLPILLLQDIENLPIFVNNNFFLLSFILVTILSSHLATRMRFKEFSGRFKLAAANEELKKLDVLKSQFFANVSHEVRTPLTSILAPIQSLYQGDLGDLSEEQRDMVGQMYRNALKLLDMINQMLDFSKYEARRMQLRLRRVDLHELAEDTVSIFREVTERKGVRLFCLRDNDPGVVYLDSEKIERILTNLVRNAIKFTENGSITVRVGRNHRKLYIEVRDTGIGIPSQHLPHIFKRFQQVDGSSTRKFEGTGLGLTIVKEAVDLMQGSVSVQSEEGRGTSFRVELPANLEVLAKDALIDRRRIQRRTGEDSYKGAERRRAVRRRDDRTRVSVDDMAVVEQMPDVLVDAQEEELPLAPAADHVLLVEDNADLRNYVSKMLRRFGHRVSTAHDGLEGWEQARRDPPDVIVSDIMMPRMDGYELVQKIARSPETSPIPIVLMTAKPELESKLKGLKTGAVDYLSKPINIRELDARVRNLISLRQLQESRAQQAELQTRIEELTMGFSKSLEIRDYETAEHSDDVLKFGTMIAEEMGIPADQTLRHSLVLHDIGKIGIPDHILRKPGPLDKEEWATMKLHPELGANLLGQFDSYKEIANIVLAHQEHYDGTGYPNGLKGSQIPLVARIISVADAYHAMTSDRPYRKALEPQQALEELLRHRGTQFDPEVVDHFIQGLTRKGIVKPEEQPSAR
ncbi:MAG: response regulator [Spirochaetales bacterium]|nr:response regulator [Spirochaetales bacterium]